MDLAAIFSDKSKLQQLVNGLFRPFNLLQVDQVVALQVETTITLDINHQISANRNSFLDDFVISTCHGTTTAIAGAIAGAKALAYGEVSVLKRMEKKKKRQKKDQDEEKREEIEVTVEMKKEDAALVAQTTADASTCLSIDDGKGDYRVELKCAAIRETARILLVVDLVSEVESILAAREALSKLGCDVVGVSFVVATKTNVLHSLTSAQVTYCCLWGVNNGLTLRPSLLSANGFSSGSDSCGVGSGQGARKRQRIAGMNTDIPAQVVLSHCTSEYQANSPSEDRSVNVVKSTDTRVQINAVFDGHGGSRAVDHICSSLCQDILAEITSDSSSDEVHAIVDCAFSHSDETFKQSLLALAPSIRMSKGYCNAGSCAVIALFVHKVLYVANVGDCAAVLGKKNTETGELQAVEVSADHSCDNAHETKLVIERSHDRNAIRMSKDDLAAGLGIVGAQRVAGSLAMTRAFGDFYLKCPELSMVPFEGKVPYITSKPSIFTIHLDGSEKYVILASDGLWDVMTPEEAVQIVDKFDLEHSLFFTDSSTALIHAALEKIAHRDGLMMHELMSMPQGSVRRRIHDDITCTVVCIEHQNCAQQSSTAHPDTNGTTPDA